MARRSAKDDTRFLRLRPVVRRRGKGATAPRRYMYAGMLYLETSGWYEVDIKTAEHLGGVRENRDDDRSPLVFEVVTREQAQAIDKRETERASRGGRASPGNAHKAIRVGAAARQPAKAQSEIEAGDLTVDDLARGTSRERARKGARGSQAAAGR